MSDPQIAIVRDSDGAVHHSSRYSKFVVDGLADGSLVEVDEQGDEVSDGPAETSGASVDPEPVKRRGGSGDRKLQADSDDTRTDSGKA